LNREQACLVPSWENFVTLAANLGENWVIDGGFTISYFLFALILITEGAGKYSVDYLLLRRKESKLFLLKKIS
jgi:uncharacterized membrane protein YphA (DoxX/SURF4 family)